MDATNQELIGTLEECDGMLAFAHESLDAGDDASVVASKDAVLAYTARLRAMLDEMDAKVRERVESAE